MAISNYGDDTSVGATVREHVVTAATSLALLAFEEYGDVTAWRDIADANGLEIFDRLPVGDTLQLPQQSQLTQQLAAQLATQLDLTAVLALSKRVDGFSAVDWLL